MGFIKKIKDIENNMKVSNFIKGYIINKWIFNGAIILMIILFFVVWSEYGFTNIRSPNIYLECESPNSKCINELYELCNPDSNNIKLIGDNNICDRLDPYMYKNEFMLEGESIGHKPSFLASNSITIFLLILFLAFIINHFVYKKNRKFKFTRRY